MRAALTILLLLFAVWLFRRFRPRGRARQWTVSRRHTPDFPEVRAAVHELGHLLAAWFCPLVVRILDVSISDDGDGRCSYVRRDGKTSSELWTHAVISLAGPAAEIIFYGRGRSRHSEQDWMGALQSAQALVKLGSLIPPWPEASMLAWTTSKSFNVRAVYAGELDEEALSIVQASYEMAKYIVRTYQKELAMLVSPLLTTRRLVHRDLERVLGSRVPVMLLGPFARTAFFIAHEERT